MIKSIWGDCPSRGIISKKATKVMKVMKVVFL